MVLVKICGNTSKEDAAKALEYGADLIGVIVNVPVKTPRKVSLKTAKEIYSVVPRGKRVMVLMPSGIDEVIRLCSEAEPDYIQLHGGESPELLMELRKVLPCRIIKTIHVSGAGAVDEARKFSSLCDLLLLDTPSASMGGSGVKHDWRVSRDVVSAIEVPVILAGGLNPENVGEAVRRVRPYGVDVSSGVESKPGKKDYDRVKNFIEAAKRANHGNN
jgi:phosphoribosylanthranilate isomerase